MHDDPSPSRGRRALLACGMAAGPLFVGTFTLLGARRSGYEPGRHPVSALSLGGSGWTQKANFLVTGALTTACAAGLRGRRGGPWLPRLVGAVGVGLVGAGVFECDPIGGYPPGTPPSPVERTTEGVLHDLCSAPVFLGLPAAAVVTARGGGAAGVCSAGSAVAMLAFFGQASRGFAQVEGVAGRAGLFQRTALVTGFGWLTVLAAATRRRVT